MSKSLKKTIRECQGDICECLRERIEQLAFAPTKEAGGGTQGLSQRFEQQVARGAQGPGTPSWVNHENEIVKQQDNLKKHLEEYDNQGCGGGSTALMVHARNLASRPVPTRAEWEANNPLAAVDSGWSTGEVVAGAAVGAGALYVGYRVIRMLPSLLPPMWWSIPANAMMP